MKKLKTGKYSGIILAIALFVILEAAVLLGNFFMAAQFARDTELVNLAARQQTLSQQTVKALLQTDNALGSGNFVDQPLLEFKNSFRLFDETLTAFQIGGEVTTPAGERAVIEPLTDPALKPSMLEAAKVWEGFRAKAQFIADFEGNIERDADFEVDEAEAQLEGAMYEAIVFSAENNVSANLLQHINEVAVGLERNAAARARLARWLQIAGIVLALGAFGLIVGYFLGNLRRTDTALEMTEQEKDEILNTVNEGLFLLDKDMRFGSQYSRQAAAIFRRRNLAGQEFLELLKEMVPEKTLETARDYIGLFFGGRVNERLVDDLNPLDRVEVHFRDENGGFVTRYLCFSFKRVVVNEDLSHLLVTVNDITETVALRNMLDQARDQGRSQIDLMMDVLHIESGVLSDFLTTAESDLEAINTVLKGKGQSQSDYVTKLDEIFRRSHSVKGEAGALGLGSLSHLAHKLEDQVVKLKDNPALAGGDFLPLTMRLDELMGHVLLVRKLTGDLAKFRGSVAAPAAANASGERQDARATERRSVPTMLSALGDRIAQEQGKQVEVVCHGFDMRGVSDEMRKAIKDICVQFVRNGVTHGIETPDERLQMQKDQLGHITITFKRVGDQFEMIYRDDGRGLDVEIIRKAALARGFVAADQVDQLDDRQALALIFRRGFSTADSVDGNAGRGVGMDVIRHSIQSLGGKVRMSTLAGKHMSFTVLLPAISAVTETEVAA